MIRMKKELILISSILIIATTIFFIVAIIVYKNNGELAIDNNIQDKVYSLRGEKGGFIYFIFRIITEFGYVYAAVVIILFMAIFSKFDRGTVIAIFGIIFATILNLVLKLYFDRERPNSALQWMRESDTSFPSGHSCTAAFLYSYLTYYLFKNNKKKIIKYTLLIVSIVLIPTIMLSRIVLGMHYFSDIIAGAMVGIISFCISAFIYMLFERYGILDKSIISFKRKKDEEESINS